jgi:hypothetical protein
MTHQDKISIIITFVCGFFVGAYLYISGFAPTYMLPDAVSEDTYGGLVIVADSYGECAESEGCLSFQLLNDREFSAKIGRLSNAYSYDGEISKKLYYALLTELSTSSLSQVAQSPDSLVCRYGEVGTNFRFLITLSGENYTVDTCRSLLDYESPLWLTLSELFGVVARAAE